VRVWTYWPVVHAVAGDAVTVFGLPAINASTDAGAFVFAGVHVPGVPAVAPVDGGRYSAAGSDSS
jgi:hypothetical protein